MRRKERNTSLYTPKRRGGVIGKKGYGFQDAYIVAHLPDWLDRVDFHSVLQEGFEDVDVRFENVDGVESWHYQLKDHPVQKAEFGDVLKGFREIEKREGTSVTRLVLGCCGVGREIGALWRRIEEYRGARKSLSERELKTTRAALVAECRRLGLGDFTNLILGKLVIDTDHGDLRDGTSKALAERFRGRFIRLPLYRNEEPSVLDDLLSKLAFLISQSIRVGITRPELERLIISELAKAAKGPAFVVHLHGWSRQTYRTSPDAVIDWTKLFDHTTLRIAHPAVWNKMLLPELRKVHDRCVAENKRNIWLFSKAPLSAGFAFGYTFSAAEGYNLRIEQPSPGAPQGLQYWETGDSSDPAFDVHVEETPGVTDSRDIAVAIGVTGDPRPNIHTYVTDSRLALKSTLYIAPSGGPHETSLNSKTVAAFARAAKEKIRAACYKHLPRRIHLFYFGPLGLAVFLGQKLNGLADIQCYERSKTKGYAPSCVLPA